MLNRFMNFLKEKIQVFLSAFVPTYENIFGTAEQHTNSSDARLMIAKKALKGNLSYFIEKRFRDQTFTAIENWQAKRTAYEETQGILEKLIDERSMLGRLVPSYAIAQMLMSFGFFSISRQLLVTRASLASPFPGPELQLLRELGLRRFQKIYRDIISIRGGTEKGLSEQTKEFICHGKPAATTSEREWLIIGNAPKEEKQNYSEYSSVVVTVTSSTSKDEIRSLLEKRPIRVLLNSSFVKKDLLEIEAMDWINLLSKCEVVYCKPDVLDATRNLIGSDVQSAMSNTVHLWGSIGQPNLVQWAAGLAISQEKGNVVISVEGANLFAGKDIYSFDEANNKVNNVNSSSEFRLCSAVAAHGPVVNFLVMRKLWEVGYIDGGKNFIELLSNDLASYLEALDERLGKLRV